MEEIVKAIKEGNALFDYAKRAWAWFTHITDWNSWQGLLARALIAVVVFSACMWLLRKGLEWFVAIQESWKKAGLPVPMSAEQRESVRRRSQFCKVIRSDLDTLNKAENWNDQFFTDLEAEVEAQGWYYASRFDALIRRRSFGLRRVRSLIKAIETSTEQALLLVGEPGSGKSVALRHLAHQLADRGAKSTDSNAKIPLYVNLKELPRPPKSGPNADWIRTFVIDNVRRGDADTADYIKEHWEKHLRNGIWFFLFDSFDEIPAVMHAPAGNYVIKEYAEAIRQFLATMSDCRGILASREFKGPESLPWQKFRILPLSNARQDELIDNSFLQQKQKQIVRRHLAASISNLRQNPLFLTLLCRYVKQESRAPVSDHDLLSKHIIRLAERDPEYIRKKHGLSPAQLLDGAMELAVLFAMDPQLSLAPTHDQIAEALPLGSFARKKLDSLLAALVDVKIGRSDVQEARRGDRRFTFSHRRYQEVLFVRYLALYPSYIPAHDLLLDQRWREYTVALLQTESRATLTPILEEATRLLMQFGQKQDVVPALRGFGENLSYYNWNGPEVHLLDLLQEGLGRRLGEIPQSLTEAVERLLSVRWLEGDFTDRAMVIRRGGLLPQSRLLEYLSFAVSLEINFLQDAAFESIVFLRDVPSSLVQWIREQLSTQALLSKSRPEELRLQALGARIPPAVGAETILRRCSRLRSVMMPLVWLSRRHNKISFLYEKIPLFRRYIERVFSTPGFGVSSPLVPVLVYLNLISVGFLAEGIFPLPVAFAVEVFVVSVSIYYICRTVVGNKPRDFVQTLSGKESVAFFALLAIVIASSFILGANLVSKERLDAVFNVFLGLSFFFAIGMLVFDVRRRLKQLKRLDVFLAKAAATSPLIQAESLSELQTWLSARKSTLLPDEQHVRSLSCVILHGVKQKPSSLGLVPSFVSKIAWMAYVEFRISSLRMIGSLVEFIHLKK